MASRLSTLTKYNGVLIINWVIGDTFLFCNFNQNTSDILGIELQNVLFEMAAFLSRFTYVNCGLD